MNNNIILNTDSYKASHFLQYPQGTERIYSYIEARRSGLGVSQTVFFGLQAFLKEYLSKPISKEDIDEAEAIFLAHGEPFNREGWEIILNEYGGYLPLKITAVPEGTPVNVGNVLVQVYNTDPRLAWLTSYVETALLRAIWYPTTVATLSWAIKNDMLEVAKETGTAIDSVNFKLHDFGARGVSSNESAMLGGMGHIVNFMGTDTVAALVGARKYYGADMPAYSIPAAEHSTITVWGKENEVDAYRNMLKQFAKPGSLVAVVSDSYDIYNAAENIWGGILKETVLNSGATMIVRPDSGDPVMTPVQVIEILAKKYGYTVNERGYMVLPDNIRVIQGDGVNKDSINQIMNVLADRGYALENIAFGMGGALLQQVNRDTFGFAMKASYAFVNGKGRDVFKEASGKKSKKGILALNKNDGGSFVTRVSWDSVGQNYLVPVFENGEICLEYTFDQVRKNTGLF